MVRDFISRDIGYIAIVNTMNQLTTNVRAGDTNISPLEQANKSNLKEIRMQYGIRYVQVFSPYISLWTFRISEQ